MKTDKLLSVIVPVYNGEQFLTETLHSISNSTYQNLEILIVDDGSTDQSKAVYQQFAALDRRFVIIKQENQGIVGARNTGLKRANGDYVVFCDQDDKVDPNFYQYAIEKMERDNSRICICSTARFYQDKSVVYEQHVDKLYTGNEIMEELLFPSLFANFRFEKSDTQVRGKMTLWNCVIRKDLIDQNKLVFKRNVNYEDDLIMRFELMILSERISTLKYCGYFWRTNLSSESHRSKYIEEIHKRQEITRNYLKEQLASKGMGDYIESYVNLQKIPDCIKILENEMCHQVSRKEKYKAVKTVLPTVIDKQVKTYSYRLNKGEIRYRIVWFFLRRDMYIGAYWMNAFLCGVIKILNRLKIANAVEERVKKS